VNSDFIQSEGPFFIFWGEFTLRPSEPIKS
jgi:hypothetical protein